MRRTICLAVGAWALATGAAYADRFEATFDRAGVHFRAVDGVVARAGGFGLIA